MKTALIIYAHPYERSFNKAILDTAIAALESAHMRVLVEDLNKEGFNPVVSAEDLAAHTGAGTGSSDIDTCQARMKAADYLVFIYPVWWGGMPAILKGYIERVLVSGFAYAHGKPLLAGKKAIIFNTTGNAEEGLVSGGVTAAMNLLSEKVALGFAGIETVEHKYFYAVPSSTPEERADMLEYVKKTLKELK